MVYPTFLAIYLLPLLVTSFPDTRNTRNDNSGIAVSDYHETCRYNGEEGLCMYQWECSYTGGIAVGICMHGFQFGACCKHDLFSNEVTGESSLSSTTPSSEEPTKNGSATVEVIDYHTKQSCGVQQKSIVKTGRIVNGTQAYVGEFPWQVSIMLYKDIEKGFEHHCGGALLNEQWVVTAAHCIARSLLIEIKVRVGEHDLGFNDEVHPYRDFKVKRKVVHKDYLSNSRPNDHSFENDIALLELKDPVTFKRHVAPICLPGSDDLLVGRSALVTGWGKREEGGNVTQILQKVFLPILRNSECEELYSKSGVDQHIPEIFLCAGYSQGGSDACSGDSGGPLQTVSKDGRYILSGIVSWGSGCGEANKPGVYTRISKYVSWILEEIGFYLFSKIVIRTFVRITLLPAEIMLQENELLIKCNKVQ